MGEAVDKIVKVSTLGLIGADDIIGGEKKPNISDPEEMPDADSKMASKKAMREQQRRRRTGRTSTILSNSKLG
jgi:hypothetical protein